jgi:hypothetical protein
MTKRPHAWKCVFSVSLMVTLFIGTWAATSTRLTSARNNPSGTNPSRANLANAARSNVAAAPNAAPAFTVDVTSAFELDGNAVASGGALDDWSTLQSGAGSAIAKTIGTAPGGVAIADLDGVTIYTGGGSKDDLDVPNWRYKSGSVPPKDEITNAYAALYAVPGGSGNEQILVFGADRFAQSGASQIGFWFFQNDVHPAAGSDTFTANHKNGDILILSDFTQGGAITTIRVFQWHFPGGSVNGTLDQVGIGADCTAGGSPKFFCGEVNAAPQTAPWSYVPKAGAAGTFPTGGFYEGGINLSALGIADACFASFLAETRSSPSVDATLKDFVQGSFPQKPTVSAPDAKLTCANPSVQITATASDPAATFHWTGPNGFDFTGNPATISVGGTYHVTAISQTGCESDADTVEVTEDKTAPSVSAGSDKLLTCAITSVTLDGSPASGVNYSWAKCSNPADTSTCTITTGFSPSNTVQSPSVSAPGTYQLTVTNPNNGCFNSDLVAVTEDKTPPSLSIAKTGANGNADPQTVTAGFPGGAPAGTAFQWQSCVPPADCAVNGAGWANLSGQTGSSLTFSNFQSSAATSFSIDALFGNAAGSYVGRLFVVNLRVAGTTTANGCSANSNAVVVKKVVAVDP